MSKNKPTVEEIKSNPEGTTLMVFPDDKFVDGEVVAQANEPVEIANTSVERWMKRGGSIVGEDVTIDEIEDNKNKFAEETRKQLRDSLSRKNVEELQEICKDLELEDCEGLEDKELLVDLIIEDTTREEDGL